MQIAFLWATVAVPVLLWAVSLRYPRAARISAFGLGVSLVGIEVINVALKSMDGHFDPYTLMPMHLCHWALVCAAIALCSPKVLWAFELAYFWGLAGTLQGLLTPAISMDIPWFQLFAFFYSHAGIVAGVLILLLVDRLRPTLSSLLRTVAASMLYLITALAVNGSLGTNYGFLRERPATASLLGILADEPWLYILQLNLLAWAFFAALYLPWFVCDCWRGKQLNWKVAGFAVER